jgi:hypothetical protein
MWEKPRPDKIATKPSKYVSQQSSDAERMRIQRFVGSLGYLVKWSYGMCKARRQRNNADSSQGTSANLTENLTSISNLDPKHSQFPRSQLDPPYATVNQFIGIMECFIKDAERHRSYMEYVRSVSRPYNLSHIHTFQTIESFGDGISYTACDGIPRFRMTASPTSWKTRLVTVDNFLSIGLMGPDPPNPFIEQIEYNRRHPIDCGDGGDGVFLENWDTRYDRTNMTQRAWCSEIVDRYMPVERQRLFDLDEATSMHQMHRESTCNEECEYFWKDEFVLLYWPPSITERDICAAEGEGTAITVSSSVVPYVAVLNEITFRGQDLYWVGGTNSIWPTDNLYFNVNTRGMTASSSSIGLSVLTGPFTLTYPTLYIAHHDIIATEGGERRKFGSSKPTLLPNTETVRTAGIFPIHSSDLYSIRKPRSPADGRNWIEFIQDVVGGKYNPRVAHTERFTGEPFNLGHLQDPVPASLFYGARGKDCWGTLFQTHCSVITDGHYRPRLSFPSHVLSSVFGNEYTRCTMPALIDPPVALSPIRWKTELAPISVTRNERATPFLQSASPGSNIESPWPGPTATMRNADVSTRSKSSASGSSGHIKNDLLQRLAVGVLICLVNLIR